MIVYKSANSWHQCPAYIGNAIAWSIEENVEDGGAVGSGGGGHGHVFGKHVLKGIAVPLITIVRGHLGRGRALWEFELPNHVLGKIRIS